MDSYVTYAGSLHDNVEKTLCIRSSPPCATAALPASPRFRQNAKLTLVSSVSIVEGGYHDVTLRATSNKN